MSKSSFKISTFILFAAYLTYFLLAYDTGLRSIDFFSYTSELKIGKAMFFATFSLQFIFRLSFIRNYIESRMAKTAIVLDYVGLTLILPALLGYFKYFFYIDFWPWLSILILIPISHLIMTVSLCVNILAFYKWFFIRDTNVIGKGFSQIGAENTLVQNTNKKIINYKKLYSILGVILVVVVWLLASGRINDNCPVGQMSYFSSCSCSNQCGWSIPVNDCAIECDSIDF